MKKYLFDIESNNFLELMTTIHCIVIEDVDTGDIFKYRPDQIEQGLEKLKEADLLIGHNIIGFDIPAIKKLFPLWETSAQIYDTLIAAKLIYPDLYDTDWSLVKQGRLTSNLVGKYSLESFGMRLGELKGNYGKKDNAFDVFTEEMLTYCEQDVKVNTKLYLKLIGKDLEQSILDMEQEVQRLCCEQTAFGFDFDEVKAQKLLEVLTVRKIELIKEIEEVLGGVFVYPLEEKTPTSSTQFKDPTRASTRKGASYTKIKLQEFNIQSRFHIGERLVKRCNWVPVEYNTDSTPVLDEEVLKTIKHPIAMKISELFIIQKRLGMLSDGQQAWMSLVKNGKIHGSVNTLGAATGRATHSKPNLGQIPSTKVEYGPECRGLFIAPKNWKLFGTDAAGLELRCLAHYMAKFDNGEYANIILKDDVHTANKNAAGLETRNQAKTFIYAFIYGAGNEKIGEIIGGSAKAGGQLKAQFLKNFPALQELRDKVEYQSRSKGKIRGLDGRYIPIAKVYSSLNYLLQSAGAIICKHWMVNMNRLLRENGYKHGVDYAQVAWVHDELQFVFNPEKLTGETLGAFSQQAMNEVKDTLGCRIDLGVDWKVGMSYAETH